MTYTIPKYLLKRFAILAYSEEHNWLNATEMARELHRQGIDVSVVLITLVLKTHGWEREPLDDGSVWWFNPRFRESVEALRWEQ